MRGKDPALVIHGAALVKALVDYYLQRRRTQYGDV
jgi:hypothetical protein